jgi:hypothetical protein
LDGAWTELGPSNLVDRLRVAKSPPASVVGVVKHLNKRFTGMIISEYITKIKLKFAGISRYSTRLRAKLTNATASCLLLDNLGEPRYLLSQII